MPIYKDPGVHIEEQPATGPISGVGTSTAAFIGPAADGPIGVPTKITNRSQFFDTFGGYVSAPRVFLAHAVEALFRNAGAGAVAYVVRVGTATRAFRDLPASKGGEVALRVQAKREPPHGVGLSVEVADAQRVVGAPAAKPTATVKTATGARIVVARAQEAAGLRPGDFVTIDGTSERVELDRVRGAELLLANSLAESHSSGTLRIADLTAGQARWRLQSAAGLEAGSAISVSQEGVEPENTVVEAVAGDFITVAPALKAAHGMAAEATPVAVSSFEFTLTIRGPNQGDELFGELAMDPRHSRFYARVVASVSVDVGPHPTQPTTQPPPDNRPAETKDGGGKLTPLPLEGGTADDKTNIPADRYSDALDRLAKVEDVNLVAIPDRTDATVQQALIRHCEELGDRFALLDAGRNAPPFGSGNVVDQRNALESKYGFAALYYPWVAIADPQAGNGAQLLVPPSGHISGVCARVDAARGVQKAPANEPLIGALAVERVLDKAEHGELNGAGINVIRTFPNRAVPTVMGARTTAPPAEAPWLYVSVRRLMNYIEESIALGILWAVFELNDQTLWQNLKRTIGEFLARVWRDGGLFGATAEEAFYVKCDEETNPPPLVALGRVTVEVGVALVRPAEFVVVRIGQWEGGSEVTVL